MMASSVFVSSFNGCDGIGRRRFSTSGGKNEALLGLCATRTSSSSSRSSFSGARRRRFSETTTTKCVLANDKDISNNKTPGKNKKHTDRREKKIQKHKKQNFFEIFHEMSKTCNSQSLVQKEHSLSLSLSLSLHHHRERRRRKSFTTQIFDDDEWW